MMYSRKLIILFIILAMSLPYTYGGCVLVFSSGDIETHKDADVSDTSPVFAGKTSRAVITPANAKTLAGGALAGGLSELNPASTGFNQDSMLTQPNAFSSGRLPAVLKDALQEVEITRTAAGGLFKPAVDTSVGELQGACGGRLSYSVDFAYKSREFNGSFSFENYCGHTLAISGETDIDGSYDSESGAYSTAQFSFADLSEGHIKLDGEISLDFLQSPIMATFTAYSKNLESGQVYWIKDYSMNLAEFTDYLEIEIFGTFYHPAHGFVNLTTTEPFIVHHEDDWPTSGQLMIRGEKNTKAELSALDQLTFFVKADTDGDGAFDWDSGILNWAGF